MKPGSEVSIPTDRDSGWVLEMSNNSSSSTSPPDAQNQSDQREVNGDVSTIDQHVFERPLFEQRNDDEHRRRPTDAGQQSGSDTPLPSGLALSQKECKVVGNNPRQNQRQRVGLYRVGFGALLVTQSGFLLPGFEKEQRRIPQRANNQAQHRTHENSQMINV